MAETLTTAEPNSVIADEGMIYCRFPSGEIQATDASPMELMKKVNRGIQVLQDYGQFGSSAYYMDHPFEPLFQAGGAHEMSLDQVVELGYHLRPPLVPTCEQHVGIGKEHLTHVGRPGAASAKGQGCWRGSRPARFPQLEGIELPPAPAACEFCDRDDFPTERARQQHQDVMHRERTQQQQLGDTIVQGLQHTALPTGSLDPQTIAAVVAATLQTLGYGTRRPDPQPDPEPSEDDEDVAEGEEEPVPTPAPPQVRRPLSDRQRDALSRARAAAAEARRTSTLIGSQN